MQCCKVAHLYFILLTLGRRRKATIPPHLMVLPECYKGVTRVLQGCNKNTTRIVKGSGLTCAKLLSTKVWLVSIFAVSFSVFSMGWVELVG
jgi:hypothetical protein